MGRLGSVFRGGDAEKGDLLFKRAEALGELFPNGALADGVGIEGMGALPFGGGGFGAADLFLKAGGAIAELLSGVLIAEAFGIGGGFGLGGLKGAVAGRDAAQLVPEFFQLLGGGAGTMAGFGAVEQRFAQGQRGVVVGEEGLNALHAGDGIGIGGVGQFEKDLAVASRKDAPGLFGTAELDVVGGGFVDGNFFEDREEFPAFDFGQTLSGFVIDIGRRRGDDAPSDGVEFGGRRQGKEEECREEEEECAHGWISSDRRRGCRRECGACRFPRSS